MSIHSIQSSSSAMEASRVSQASAPKPNAASAPGVGPAAVVKISARAAELSAAAGDVDHDGDAH